jgi:hypothetical protein
MKNLTLAVDDHVLDGVRKYAANHGTTVNAIVREHLTRIATQEDRAAHARRELVELAKTSTLDLGPDWKWSREATYDSRLLPRHERGAVRGGGSAARNAKSAKGA